MRKKPSRAAPIVKKKPVANLKNNGRWLWLAIETGRGKRVPTREEGTKRIAYKFLPRKAEALENKPRGFDEITNALSEHVMKGSTLVFDGWTATQAAVARLGFKHAPPVAHAHEYRDKSTGFHTNDAESENARLKRWNRQRYGRLAVSEEEMMEYTFYVNVGKSISSVMKGLCVVR